MRGGGGARGGGGLNTGSQTTILCVSWVTKQMVYLISATCLDDLCAAISSPGKPAVGGSKRTEVWSYIWRLKSDVKSSHQMLVKIVWPN